MFRKIKGKTLKKLNSEIINIKFYLYILKLYFIYK